MDQQRGHGPGQQPEHFPHVNRHRVNAHLGRTPEMFQQALVQAQKEKIGHALKSAPANRAGG